jgi:hypothetical protein
MKNIKIEPIYISKDLIDLSDAELDSEKYQFYKQKGF